jgi:OsmC subfamily peroxiredoxin
MDEMIPNAPLANRPSTALPPRAVELWLRSVRLGVLLSPGIYPDLPDQLAVGGTRRSIPHVPSLRGRAGTGEESCNDDCLLSRRPPKGSAGAPFEGPYSLKSRIEEEQSATNPEELLGAAHTGCFTMALTMQLSRKGLTPRRIHTVANVKLDDVKDAFAITRVELETEADIPGSDERAFQAIAIEARKSCDWPLGR